MNTLNDDIKIGDVVALKSNPLFEGLTKVIVSGDSETLSPLMVVSEIAVAKAKAGSASAPVRSCKCIWYSHKSWSFEEAWLASPLLKKVTGSSEVNINEDDWQIGTLVSLKTLDLELSKRKSFLQFEGNDADDKNGRSTIHHVLSFLSPVMHVVELKRYEAKKNGRQPKPNLEFIHPEKAVKCKWFNAATEKMSEAVLPLNSLSIIPQPNTQLLRNIEKAINTKSVCLVTKGTALTCVRPLDLVYRSGRYLVRAFDYIENRVFEVKPEELGEALDGLILQRAPLFCLTTDESRTSFEILQQERLQCIETAISKSSYLRIKYLNNQQKPIWRTLSGYRIFSLNEQQGTITYLSGHCHSKKEERTFRVDKILKMEELNLTFNTGNGLEEASGFSQSANDKSLVKLDNTIAGALVQQHAPSISQNETTE